MRSGPDFGFHEPLEEEDKGTGVNKTTLVPLSVTRQAHVKFTEIAGLLLS